MSHFCFGYTESTEIYPLSLHDALPIWQGFIAMAAATDFGSTGLWTRINALNSPWALDDVIEIVSAVGNKLDVIMLPKVDRKSTRLNSSHMSISYAVFCLKKKIYLCVS